MHAAAALKPVTRCVCSNVKFLTMKDFGVDSVDDAISKFGVGRNCGHCVRYIQKMIETGETEFDVIE